MSSLSLPLFSREEAEAQRVHILASSRSLVGELDSGPVPLPKPLHFPSHPLRCFGAAGTAWFRLVGLLLIHLRATWWGWGLHTYHLDK